VANLTSVWKEFARSLGDPPYALPEDLEILREAGTVSFTTYRHYLRSGLEGTGDPGFHLGLLPQPWFGDPMSASVFLLLLNPGVNPGDYYSEYFVPKYRRALIDNLLLRPNRKFPLVFMAPEFCWLPGARYFRQRFHWVARELVALAGIAYRKALAVIASEICVMQLVPYHSSAFRMSSGQMSRLTSTRLIKSFVLESVVPRRDVLVIVTRKIAEWGVPSQRNTILFMRGQARSASISRESEVGRRLVRHLVRRAS
jgi:hypothetical protein